MSETTPTTPRDWKSPFLFLSWCHMLWLSAPYLLPHAAEVDFSWSTLFRTSGWLFYSLLYLVPAWLLTHACLWWSARSRYLCTVLALTSSWSLLALIRVDLGIYDLYRFHINGFVLNLLFTPGGLESLGGSASSFVSVAALAARLLLVQAVLLALSVGAARWTPAPLRRTGTAVLAGALLFLIQGSLYGISDIQRYGPVLEHSRAIPLFQRVRFRSLAEYLGHRREDQPRYNAGTDSSTLRYPLAPLEYTDPVSRPNIVVLVAESLRWDQLSPELMPNTWAFGEQNQQFKQHYSSGNGTREGLFGMFYGLHGSYWDTFLHAGRGPLLVDRLLALDYDFDVRTSATFTYPEFDRTLFAALPATSLVQADAALPAWERDERNTDALLARLAAHDAERPLMSFFFFESTHASYSFPAQSAVIADYAQELDYGTLTRETLARDHDALFARYQNAAHWVDVQMGRIFEALETNGMLENTIVIVTGDHGEEFMEHGNWGHNTTFVDEQTHVPLVVHWPGAAPLTHDNPTSHLDIATTLLHALGAPEDSDTYSLGQDLFEPQPRDHIVISDWHSIAVRTQSLKYRIPYLYAGADYWAPAAADDTPLDGERADILVKEAHEQLLDAIAGTSRFLKK